MQNAQLKDQIALVTGSSQGIGAGIAKRFASEGARLVIHGREEGSAAAVACAIRDAGGEAVESWGDLRDAAVCRDLVRLALEHFGQLDILVNNAASTARSTIEDPVSVWDDIFAVNLRAPFILCQEAARHMKVRRRGCIINIGSVNAYVGGKKLLAYSASKGGLMTLTKNLANALARDGVRVNQINPGWVLTEGERYVQSVIEGRGEGWLAETLRTRPSGRMLSPEQIAHAALFFATAELITGSVIDYDQFPTGAPE